MYGFWTYHWPVTSLPDEAHAALVQLNALSAELPSDGYPASNEPALVAAFQILLDHIELRVRGIALDQYCYAEAQTRWGHDNPFRAVDGHVATVARAFLARSESEALSSALMVLWHLGTASDLPTVMAILEARDSRVDFDTAFGALRTCLLAADQSIAQPIAVRLVEIVEDPSRSLDVRAEALRTFATTGLYGQAPRIAALLFADELRLAASAAFALVQDPAYREQVRAAAAQWPEDAPAPAFEVRGELE